MNNLKIRVAMISNNVKQWEVAELLKVSEPSLSRMLRHELPEEEQDRIINLIEESKKGTNENEAITGSDQID